MVIQFLDTFIQSAAAIGANKEHKGPLGALMDYCYDDHYAGCNSFEDGEVQLSKKAILTSIEKSKIPLKEIDLMIGGDLTNQMAISNYTCKEFPFPYLGMYGACSTIIKSLGTASLFISTNYARNVIAFTSSSCGTAERQFRYPNNYGSQKKDTTTVTATGGAAFVVGRRKSKIKVKTFTIGRVYDPGIKDVNDMGSPMAYAAYQTIKEHFNTLGITPNYYDQILTGDLSSVGTKVLLKCFETDGITLRNHADAGMLLYKRREERMFAGGSGSACVGLVTATHVMNKLLSGRFKRILIVGTGSLFSPTMVQQKHTIPVVAHAISLERVEQ